MTVFLFDELLVAAERSEAAMWSPCPPWLRTSLPPYGQPCHPATSRTPNRIDGESPGGRPRIPQTKR